MIRKIRNKNPAGRLKKILSRLGKHYNLLVILIYFDANVFPVILRFIFFFLFYLFVRIHCKRSDRVDREKERKEEAKTGIKKRSETLYK